MSIATYPGEELSLFAAARNWKRYWSSRALPFVRGAVLEVGAGIGANLEYLESDAIESWVALEPDADLASQIPGKRGYRFDVVVGTTASLPVREQFDAILYIDVLEHIEGDGAELAAASARLRSGGRLIVLAPAHQWLFSSFDQAIGHWRRYTVRSLAKLTPAGCKLERLEYLDAAGLAASLANRAVLRQSMPNQRQIATWDRILVPCSRLLDPLTLHRLGKSVFAVWRKS